MTKREWATAGLVAAFIVATLAIALMAQPTHAETRIGPETVISLADICPA